MSANIINKRRGYSRKVGTLLPPSAVKVFRRFGFVEGTLIRQWRDIAGPALSQCTLPLKVSMGREKGERIGILHLLVEPAAALQVQHQIPVLIEKIKIFHGAQPIHRINLVQGRGTVGRTPKKEPETPADPAKTEKMKTWTKTMKDSGLKDSLIRLGQQILISEEK